MKTIVAVEQFNAVVERSLDRARRFDRREAVPAERRISFERPEELGAFLSSRRLSVLRAAMEQPRSVTELATALRRNRPAVSRDVQALRKVGLIHLSKGTNPGHGQVQIVKAAAKKFKFHYQLSA